MAEIRPIALAVVRDSDRLLVFEGFDPTKDEVFYRPLGGGIEFGETGEQAVRREILEEIGAEVAYARYVETLENIFVYDGAPGHEIVRVYHVVLLERSSYDRDAWDGTEGRSTLRVLWKAIDDFREGARLYPAGLLDLLYDPAAWPIDDALRDLQRR